MKNTILAIVMSVGIGMAGPALAQQKLSLAAAKKAIVAQKSSMFKDPDSIRDAKIGQPHTCLGGNGQCVCIEANAKNSYGGYTGVQLMGIRFSGSPGTAENFGEMSPTAREKPCGPLIPFPELNGRRRN